VGLGQREGLQRAHAVAIDDDHLARIDVAHELGLDQIEGAGLGGHHPAVLHLAE
jgi:hypothetical protein